LPEVLGMSMLLQPDSEAYVVASNWRQWVLYRNKKIEEWKELRNYLFATDTRTTSNQKLPWSNSTTTPKLTQIRDNLHANYMAALFPRSKWLKWKGDDEDSDNLEKRKVIETYVLAKTQQSGFKDTVSELVLDWIDTGNCFAMVEFSADITFLEGNDTVVRYIGPKVQRISPYDIVFNPVARSFSKTPKIIRELVTEGDIAAKVSTNSEDAYLLGAFDKLRRARGSVMATGASITEKADGYVADGFSDIMHYYGSGYVELLHFFGDIYNSETGELQRNRIITVADRAHVLRNIVNPSWNGSDIIRHAGWRQRPDNLYSMGPLENLVGMQYRIDHLENLKADVFDQIAYPKMKIKGEVHDFEDNLGERIYLGEDGDVGYLFPDSTALNADMQIANLEQKMEELAGAPKQAMGFRTPGEKTAFEVQMLQNSASRIFEFKAAHFESVFLAPLLNDMLECGRRNMDKHEIISVMEEDLGIELFQTITRDDIAGRGNLQPVGASHFAEKANRIQTLNNIWQIKMSDPTVGTHLSGKKFASILTTELDEEGLYGDNIAIFEGMETQRLAQEGQQVAEEEDMAMLEQEG